MIKQCLKRVDMLRQRREFTRLVLRSQTCAHLVGSYDDAAYSADFEMLTDAYK